MEELCSLAIYMKMIFKTCHLHALPLCAPSDLHAGGPDWRVLHQAMSTIILSDNAVGVNVRDAL